MSSLTLARRMGETEAQTTLARPRLLISWRRLRESRPEADVEGLADRPQPVAHAGAGRRGGRLGPLRWRRVPSRSP